LTFVEIKIKILTKIKNANNVLEQFFLANPQARARLSNVIKVLYPTRVPAPILFAQHSAEFKTPKID